MESDSAIDTIILQYVAGNTSLGHTVEQLTAPISVAYATANSGNAIREAENLAARQRKVWPEDELREQFDWDEALPPKEVPDTEDQLWKLWHAVLHAAKRNPWQDDVNDVHAKLIALVAAIRRVPDPPLPADATDELRHNWIWRSGTLWSTLPSLGLTARDVWDDAWGAAFGLESAIAEWANVNGFMARLMAEELGDYLIYAIWTMGYALDKNQKNSKGNWLDAMVPGAAAWIGIWGRQMYEWQEDLVPESSSQDDVGWPFWKQRFEDIALGRALANNATRAMANEAFEKMCEIEKL